MLTTLPKSRKTCDKCTHYKRADWSWPNNGTCALMGDVNDGPNTEDRAAGWDYESYRAGVYVGPKFGCIHWVKATGEQS